jgi:hypothetical protein
VTPEEYAELGEAVHAAIITIVKSVVSPADPPAPAPPSVKGLVLDRDPVNFDETAWFGALKSGEDVDGEGQKRVHAWVIRFGGSVDPESRAVRAIEPKWIFPVEIFYSHEFGTAADNSEKRLREEVLKVQFTLAGQQRLGNIQRVSKHTDLSVRLRLGATKAQEVLHRGSGEISVELEPIQRG